MNINEVIKYPVLSEKTYPLMEQGIYTFIVDKRTNKVEVRKTIEFIFEVKVDKVNILNYDKQPKKVGKFAGFTNARKKAVVYLRDGKINIFPDEALQTETKETSVKEKPSKETHKEEMTDIEARAAQKIAEKAQAKLATETQEIAIDKKIEEDKETNK